MIKKRVPPSPPQPCGCAAALLAMDNVGEKTWWQALAEIGTPLVEPFARDQVRMSYFWRDPEGDEAHSSVRQVFIDINCVTDHHSPQPQSLQRVAGTDVWHWSTEIEPQWRGSYSLIPVRDAQRPPTFSADAETRSRQQRAWWISLFPFAIADPLNHSAPHFNSRHQPLSAAHMPGAPQQTAWHRLDSGEATQADSARLQSFTWQSDRLGNARRIWLYTTGHTDTPETRPLVMILDGQNWVEGSPLFAALESETESGHFPAAAWLFIDVIDQEWREKELPCNPTFWQAVEEELLPQARARVPFSELADRTLVTGQSYGGLAATYAGLHRPQRFGRVLSQSGSFWWPNMQLMRGADALTPREMGWLTARLVQRELPASRLTLFIEAGSREGNMAALSEQMHQALVAAGHRTHFRIFAGGHDSLCWRGGLIDGLRWLLADFLPPQYPEETGHHHD